MPAELDVHRTNQGSGIELWSEPLPQTDRQKATGAALGLDEAAWGVRTLDGSK
jgi:hypothetical protein